MMLIWHGKLTVRGICAMRSCVVGRVSLQSFKSAPIFLVSCAIFMAYLLNSSDIVLFFPLLVPVGVHGRYLYYDRCMFVYRVSGFTVYRFVRVPSCISTPLYSWIALFRVACVHFHLSGLCVVYLYIGSLHFKVIFLSDLLPIKCELCFDA